MHHEFSSLPFFINDICCAISYTKLFSSSILTVFDITNNSFKGLETWPFTSKSKGSLRYPVAWNLNTLFELRMLEMPVIRSEKVTVLYCGRFCSLRMREINVIKCFSRTQNLHLFSIRISSLYARYGTVLQGACKKKKNLQIPVRHFYGSVHERYSKHILISAELIFSQGDTILICKLITLDENLGNLTYTSVYVLYKCREEK